MLEDLPGGLASLRAAVDRFHERGVRVLLSYNPWDQGTRWGWSVMEAVNEISRKFSQ